MWIENNNSNENLMKEALKITKEESEQMKERNELIKNIKKIIKKIDIILDNTVQDFNSINVLTNESIKLNNLLVDNSKLLLEEEWSEIIQLLNKTDNVIKEFILSKTKDLFIKLKNKWIFWNEIIPNFDTLYINDFDNIDLELTNLTDDDYEYLEIFSNKMPNLYDRNQGLFTEIEKNKYIKTEKVIKKILEAKDAFDGLFEEDLENN